MKFLKVVGAILLGVIGLAVLLYVAGVAVNWRDQPPTAAALQMEKILGDRASVADRDNAFVYVLGFQAPAPEDPQVLGALRRDWLEDVNRDPKLIDGDPLKAGAGFNASRSQSSEHLAAHCGDSHSRTECRDAFIAAQSQPRLTLQELQLTRYRELLERRAWLEVVPQNPSTPLPAYGDIIEGQRLLFVDLATRAKSAPPAEIAAALRDDLRFWREVQGSADILITKMIAIAAIRQHFFFGTLVLREMRTGRAEVIESWGVPFSTEELSMRRAMAGELRFVGGVMLQWQNGADEHWIEPDEEGLTLPGRIASSLARPFYQHQDQLNYYAATYLDFAERFEAPLDQYAGIAESMQEAAPAGFSFHIYNPVGLIFRGLGTWNFSSYAYRVGSIENQRRAALLTVQLRERAVALDAMQTELNAAGLRNAFDGEPFEWNADERAVVYTGPDAEKTRKLHAYFY